MKLDDFLHQQSTVGLEVKGTIAPNPDDPNRVLITILSSDGSCACGDSLNVARTEIENVEPTNELVWCCGKQLRVANIRLALGTKIPVADVVQKMMAQSSSKLSGAECYDRCVDEYADCRASGQLSKSACLQRFRSCIAPCHYDPNNP